MNICTEFWVILNKGVFRSAFWIDKPERPKIVKLTEGVEILHAHAMICTNTKKMRKKEKTEWGECRRRERERDDQFGWKGHTLALF